MEYVEQMRYLVLAAQRQGERSLTALFAKLDVTPSQAEALRVIADNAPLSLKQLGERLVCEGGSPSRVLSTLIQKGLVISTEAEKDRRVKVLTLSSQGAKLADQIVTMEKKFYAIYKAKADDAQLKILVEGLQALVDEPQLAKALELRGITTKKETVQ